VVSPSVECDEFSFGVVIKRACASSSTYLSPTTIPYFICLIIAECIDSKMITYAYLDYVSGVDTNRSLIQPCTTRDV
jgi:hypothetical protein